MLVLPYRRFRTNPFGLFEELLDSTPCNKEERPALNVKSSNKDYTIEVALPGLSKDDVKVQLNENGDIVVSVEKKTENSETNEDNKYVRREFGYAKFTRTLTVPEDVDHDKISAKVENGVLNVLLPKKAEEIKASPERTIEVG